jgi:hypothetical protein
MGIGNAISAAIALPISIYAFVSGDVGLGVGFMTLAWGGSLVAFCCLFYASKTRASAKQTASEVSEGSWEPWEP